MERYDYLIVGAGLFGSTFAYKATKAGYIDEVEENNRTMGYRHSFVFETGTLTTSDTIEFDLREVPAGYVVTIEEVVLYHNSLTNVKEEIVDIEDYVIWTGDGTGSSGTYGNFSLALNELNNSGAIRKIVVGLNSTSNLGWASAKLQFKNLDLCSSGYANISSVVATSGTIDSEVVVYPEKIVYAGPEGATLDINCWWASPDQIKITYVKIYTA